MSAHVLTSLLASLQHVSSPGEVRLRIGESVKYQIPSPQQVQLSSDRDNCCTKEGLFSMHATWHVEAPMTSAAAARATVLSVESPIFDISNSALPRQRDLHPSTQIAHGPGYMLQ